MQDFARPKCGKVVRYPPFAVKPPERLHIEPPRPICSHRRRDMPDRRSVGSGRSMSMSETLSAGGRGRGDRLPGLSVISRFGAKEKRARDWDRDRVPLAILALPRPVGRSSQARAARRRARFDVCASQFGVTAMAIDSHLFRRNAGGAKSRACPQETLLAASGVGRMPLHQTGHHGASKPIRKGGIRTGEIGRRPRALTRRELQSVNLII